MDETSVLPPAGEIEPRRAHAALGLMADGAWWALPDLVRATAAPRRSIEALMAAVGAERSANRFRLAAPVPLDGPPPLEPAGPVDHLLPAYAGVVARMREVIAAAPRGRQELDHVAATAETVVARALLLGSRFWLREGSRLLCVGDHDLTSLAVKLVFPAVQVSVVDVDEGVLGHIDAAAAGLGVEVRTRWSDLRLALPPSLRASADLAITDPPYTPDGIGLFVARAVEGLRDPATGRVLLAYGAGDRTPMLALKVQQALQELNLLTEAMYPDFNRYFGAEAIGSAADLYVLRPTSKTVPAVAARLDRAAAPAIYTHGPQSVESQAASPAGRLLDDGFEPGVLVGTWPGDLLPKVPRARLSTWLAKPYAASPRQVALAVPSGQEAALPRLLLASRAPHTRVLTAAPADLTALAPLAPLYGLTARGTVLDAVRRPAPEDDPGRLLHTVLAKAHGKLANTWREALISLRPALTKREARALIADAAPWSADVTPLELPAHHLQALPAAIAQTLG